jgi:acyl carrier protein
MDRDAIKARMCRLLKLPEARVPDDAVLTDIVSDSFRLVETFIELQEEFGLRLTQEDLRGVQTVGQLLQLFAQRLGPPARPAAG